VTPPLFEAEAVCKRYRAPGRPDVIALDGLTLAIERGALTALTGPSGSGKTTLLALLGLLERPTSGRIVFDGKEMTNCSDVELARARRRMGFVFQDFALIPGLTAMDNITYPLIPRGVPRAERRSRAMALLERFGLAGRAEARARELSGGEQQRVAIARALAGDPEAVLADEPTSNLDAETAGVLLEALRGLHMAGRTVVVATHDPRLIEAASRVLDLRQKG
jgi:putative ABC transport system ATP-binding protein